MAIGNSKSPLVDDLKGFCALPPFTDFASLTLEDLFVIIELFENPALEVFKYEITKVLEARFGSVIAKQDLMDAHQSHFPASEE